MKRGKVVWTGKRWLATKRGRPVMCGNGEPLVCESRESAEQLEGEKAIRVLVTIERLPERG
jgi:hypothetical protein